MGIAFALLAGFCTAIEYTINSRLGKELTPSVATFHNLATGALLLLLINVMNGHIVQYGKIEAMKPYLLIGGIFGAAIIYLTAKSIPMIGVTTTLTLIIAGQLACGIVTDIFLMKLTFDYIKWIGITLVVVGSYLLVR